MYTVREIIIHLAPFRGKGIKRIVKELHEKGRVYFSPTTFFRHFDKYVANSSVLPDENFFGSKRGRKPDYVVEKVPKTMNAKEHANVSYVGDGLQDSRVALIESRKRTLEANGMCFDSDSLASSKSTIAIYNKMTTFFDPNVSLVNADTARKKSEMREKKHPLKDFSHHLFLFLCCISVNHICKRYSTNF